MILSVAEKPSVAKELANIIGNGHFQKRNGHSPYNFIFEVACDFLGRNTSMKITSVSGHMMELEFEPQYKGWKSCRPEELFTAPISKTVKRESEGIERTLREESRKCRILLLWLDCDLEGENIAFEVIEVCKKSNPNLEVYRARFSALIPRDILRNLRQPARPNEHYNQAIEARQEIDLRLGAAFTRFQSLMFQERYDELANKTISYGPCQFPTMGFVVERQAKIESFIPEEFWVIEFSYDSEDADGKLSTSFNWDRVQVFVFFSLFTSLLIETYNIRCLTDLRQLYFSRFVLRAG